MVAVGITVLDDRRDLRPRHRVDEVRRERRRNGRKRHGDIGGLRNLE